jgi:hypothetical protein
MPLPIGRSIDSRSGVLMHARAVCTGSRTRRRGRDHTVCDHETAWPELGVEQLETRNAEVFPQVKQHEVERAGKGGERLAHITYVMNGNIVLAWVDPFASSGS